MDFFVYSRSAIERVPAHDVPHIVISITSRADDLARIPESMETREIVRVSFLDVGEGAVGAMTDEDACVILHSFERHQAAITRVVVHCDAGMSRSPAVAIALARIAGVAAPELHAGVKPNAHVVATMMRAAPTPLS